MNGPYYDTVKETKQNIEDYSSIAEMQNAAILNIFKSNIGKNFTPDEIHHILGDEKILLTSVRRAISTLTIQVGVLEKTDEKRPGGRGRSTSTWTYKINSPQKSTPMSNAAQTPINDTPTDQIVSVAVVPEPETSSSLPEEKKIHPLVHQMFAGYNLGDEQQKVMGLLAQIFDRSIVLMDRFNAEKENFRVNNIDDAKLKAQAAKGFRKTVADERVALGKLVKAERDRIKQSITVETQTDKILANGFKMLEGTYKDIENHLSVTENYEANYKLEQQKKLRSERMAKLEELKIVNYVGSNDLAKIEQYSEEIYEQIIDAATSNKKQAEIIEEQKRIDEENKKVLKNRIDVLNGLYGKDHPIKNKLTIETSQDDFLKLIEELSNYVTEQRKLAEQAVPAPAPPPPSPVPQNTPAVTVGAVIPPAGAPGLFPPPPPPPPVQPAPDMFPSHNPVQPAQAVAPEPPVVQMTPAPTHTVQNEDKGRVGPNGEYIAHPHVNPSDPYWNVPAGSQQTQQKPPDPVPFSGTTVASQPAAPVSDPNNPFAVSYIPEGAIITGSGAYGVQQNVKSPEDMDREELLFFINKLELNGMPNMRTQKGIEKANLIWQKFNGFKAWAASIVSDQK